jgi:tyrosine-protein kinase Etk/Wzc
LDKENELEVKETESKSFTLLEVILIFLKNKKKILIFTGFVCVISIILYFFVFDLIYFSNATIKSSGKSGGLLSSLETGLPDVGALDEFSLGAGKSAKELATYENILKSRRCLEPLIINFDLMNRDDFKYMEDAIKNFSNDKMKLEEDRLAGVLSVGVFDKNPELAKEMVEFLLNQLDKINVELSVLNAKNNREFIEKRYYQAKDDLTKAEDTLKSFQVIYGVSPDLQIRAAAQTAYGIEAELKTAEVKLDVMKKVLNPDQPEVKLQEATVNSLHEKIQNIKNSTDINDLLSLGNSPQIVLSYLRLQRNVEIQSRILSFLLPVYEQAKIEEKKETPTITILDKPYVAEKKTKPKRLTMVLVFTSLGFALSCIYFFLRQRFHTFRSKVIKDLNKI